MKLPGEVWDSKLYLISSISAVNMKAATLTTAPCQARRLCVCVPAATCTKPVRARVDKKDPVVNTGYLSSDH